MRRFLITIAILIGFSPLSAEENQIDWSDLIDESAQSFEDPFRDLSYDQIDDLRRIVRLQTALDGGSPSAKAGTELQQVKASLSSQGLDADWLISQRWIVAEKRELADAAGNPAYDGETVKLGGFAISAPPAEDGTAMAYLVPERGMCSHVPPPPPNQMVRLRLTNGWQPAMIHEPVVVTGRIDIDPSERRMVVVDGFVPMRATFSMDVVQVETFGRKTEVQSVATNDRSVGVAKNQRDTPRTSVLGQ
ncbi:DUF3299 domain-containing protein [Lutimaribacter marinistellae]|uniref:DUF3299 domain-containing protein n=1 Tax=Lutimaribacter marinistellae TaxID=1820329 RepID=A0ABV7TC88_9RHOB